MYSYIRKNSYFRSDNQSGIALLMTILILSGVLAIGIGVATLARLELEPTREIGNSSQALTAAKSAMECQLKEERFSVGVFDCPLLTNGNWQPCLTLPAGVECKLSVIPDISIKAAGRYKGVTRSLEITF
ncbi:MAG: hypothetical protein HYV52_02625 [Parcubacteria group bacterium]|nr:hypothetical protein [Parcubacteria group bacterium]